MHRTVGRTMRGRMGKKMQRRVAYLIGALAALLGGLLGVGHVGAAPFTPSDDRQVVETLRDRPLDAHRQETRRLRKTLGEHPERMDVAVLLATRYIEQSRADADPRYLGYAQSLLTPWVDGAEPPAAVLLLRATIRQSLHDFAGAQDDLTQVLRVEPQNPQARLTAAVVHQVQGRYEEARRHCVPLVRSAGEVVAAACLASVGSLSGQAQASYELLTRVLARSATPATGGGNAERAWVLTLMADIAERLGRFGEAESHYKAAVAAAPRDLYTLGAYADFLLDRDRPREVVTLLNGERRADPLLLRVALAEARIGLPEAALDREVLAARFEASRRRGDVVHRREEARYALSLAQDPQGAVRLAQDNWTQQKEPADARILLEAALAAGTPDVARPVVDWLIATHLEDVRLAPLLARMPQVRS